MARPGTLPQEDLRTPQEEIRIVRKHKHTTTIQRRVQRGHRWMWDSTAEKVATERVLDDDGARWRTFENNPKLATWHSPRGEPQALLKIHRSYEFVTKVQVYYGRDATGITRWGEIAEIPSPDVVLDGGASWSFHPPAWETAPAAAVADHANQVDDHATAPRTDAAAMTSETTDTAVVTVAPTPTLVGQKASYLRGLQQRPEHSPPARSICLSRYSQGVRRRDLHPLPG